MAITAATSTALDVPSLVSQLMSAERKPITDLNAKVTSYQAKVSSLATIGGLVSTLQGSLQGLVGNLQSFSAVSSDTSSFSATAGTTALAGTYSVSVEHLAQAQTLAASGQASQSAALTNADSTVTFSIGGTTTSINIAAGASLQDISSAINDANFGVRASVVNDGSNTPYRLTLSSTSSGLSNAIDSITISASSDLGLDGDSTLNGLLAFNPTAHAPAPPVAPATALTQVVEPLNASLTVNGISISSPTNTVTGAIQGVTLVLKNTTAAPTTLTVARDTSAITSAVSSFVDSYNALATQLRSRSAYGSDGTTAPTLSGDGTVRQMIEQLRSIFMTPASGGTLSALSEVGITTKSDGTLSFDSAKLTSALTNDFSGVSKLFSSTTGYATRLSAWTTSITQTGGAIDQRKQVLNNSIKGYNDQIAKLEKRMTVLQAQYTTTYSNLNMLLSNMNATSTYLSQQFSKSSS